MTTQLRHHYTVTECRASIDGTCFSHRNVRMICAKNCEKLLEFVKVTAKILLVPFFLDTVYKE